MSRKTREDVSFTKVFLQFQQRILAEFMTRQSKEKKKVGKNFLADKTKNYDDREELV